MKIFYASFSRLEMSVNSVYIRGLDENGIAVTAFSPRNKDWRRYGEIYREYSSGGPYDLVMIGYDSPQLGTYLRFVTGKPVIYNALCSVYERLVISRGLATVYSLKSLYFWAIDFLAMHSSSFVMLESQHQIDYCKKVFLISQKKCFLSWTGVDGLKFQYDPTKGKFERFTATFKGQFLSEAGVEYVVQAAKKLENDGVDIILAGSGPGLKKVQAEIERLQPKNLITKFSYLADGEMVEIMGRSHLIIGQVSDHSRLERTIPHKCYEALALGIPYITGRNAGVLELLKDGETCIACNPADAGDLAAKILWAKEHPKDGERIGKNGRKLYEQELTSKILAKKLLRILNPKS